MSIKPVETIPCKDKKISAREMIRADIQEAIDNGISLFEFDGDYNYKTLANNARTVVNEMKRHETHKINRDFKEEYYTDDEKNFKGFHVFFKTGFEYHTYWITVSSMKGEGKEKRMINCKELGELRERMVSKCCPQALGTFDECVKEMFEETEINDDEAFLNTMELAYDYNLPITDEQFERFQRLKVGGKNDD